MLNQIKVFLALIIGSVFTVSFDLSQGVMCDSAVISNLNIKGKFNVNLISCALKNYLFIYLFFFLNKIYYDSSSNLHIFPYNKYFWFYRVFVRKVMHFIIMI